MANDSFDVLRGMDIEAAPFRLLRRSPVASQAPVPDNSTTNVELQRGYEAGVQQGYADGLCRGQEEGRREARDTFRAEAEPALQRAISDATTALQAREARLAALVASIEKEERARRLAAEEEMVALCYQTVCAIVGRRAIRPATVRAHLAHVASFSGGASAIALHVHPDDAALMQAIEPAATPHGKHAVRWVGDPEVALAGCRVVQRGGGLDLRLETVLEQCKELLLQARSRRRAQIQEEK